VGTRAVPERLGHEGGHGYRTTRHGGNPSARGPGTRGDDFVPPPNGLRNNTTGVGRGRTSRSSSSRERSAAGGGMRSSTARLRWRGLTRRSATRTAEGPQFEGGRNSSTRTTRSSGAGLPTEATSHSLRRRRGAQRGRDLLSPKHGQHSKLIGAGCRGRSISGAISKDGQTCRTRRW